MKPSSRTGFRLLLILLIVLGLLTIGWISSPYLLPQIQPWLAQQSLVPPDLSQRAVRPTEVMASAVTATATATPSPIPGTATNTAVPVIFQSTGSPEENLHSQGVLVLAMRDGYYSHLFAYHPVYLSLTRLTNNPWDDMTPSLSPDGTRLAYASRQNGYWDLYILNLATGQTTRLTDTPDYEASPTWSPDGQWIAYERYNGVSLDIYIQSLSDPSSAPIQLTDDPGMDRSPAWSPKGRELVFVSTRSGDEEIWLARLDNPDDRFVNISNNPQARNRNPVWSADGRYLTWASEKAGEHRLVARDQDHPELSPRTVAEGDHGAWSPDSSVLFSVVEDPQGSGLAGYQAANGQISLPYMHLPGSVYGMTWINGPLPDWLDQTLSKSSAAVVPTLWQPAITRTVLPAGRMGLVELEDVTAPQPRLHDAADEAFIALRQQVAVETGWDALSSLENAYVALTSPITPSLQEDWLYTGRAFAANPLLLSAGWMTLVREDFGGQTYWRVYLKARYQDGSMGMPMPAATWDLNARFSGNTRAYEQGGQIGSTPAGYWIDLTELASRFSWERLPSWTNWRTFYPSIRFNQFVITGGLEWHQAMAELYPPEALATTTPMPAPSAFPTDTPEFTPLPVTETPTPTITMIPTRRPTWTPLPAQTSP